MLNKAAKLALVATSLAPICLTLWFVEFSKAWNWKAGCAGLVWLAGKNLEKLPVKINSIRFSYVTI